MKNWKKFKEVFTHRAPNAGKGSDAWVQWKQRSNWATHSEEAHEKARLEYVAYNDRADQLAEMAEMEAYGGLKNPMNARPNTTG